jgi:hypothetical protein
MTRRRIGLLITRALAILMMPLTPRQRSRRSCMDRAAPNGERPRGATIVGVYPANTTQPRLRRRPEPAHRGEGCGGERGPSPRPRGGPAPALGVCDGARGSTAIRAVQRATPTIPIVLPHVPTPGTSESWNAPSKACPSRSVGDPWLHADKQARERDFLRSGIAPSRLLKNSPLKPKSRISAPYFKIAC